MLAAGLLSVTVSGCQCINDDNFSQLKDAGFEDPDAGPPPPVCPLKAGDILTIPQYGARTSVYCATSPEVAGDTGGYYSDCAVKEPSATATPELAAELWSRSEEWVAD